jgi:hypothetical protein
MPNGWEWAILVLIAVLLIGGARLSGISRDTLERPELDEAPLEGTEPKSPSSPTSAAPAVPTPAVGADPTEPLSDPAASPTETD